MTMIRPFAAGSYTTARNTQQILDLKSQLDGLSTQLSTGKVSDSYSGLGAGRNSSLSAHATLSALDGYDYAIQAAQTRVSMATASLTQVASLTTTLRRTVIDSPLNNAGTATNNAELARNGLDAAIDALNQQLDGQYVFGGRMQDKPPLAATGTLLNGDGTADGLNQVVKEQIDADLGNDLPAPSTGLGRLTLAPPGSGLPATPTNQISLTEEGNATTRADFGFQLASTPAPATTGKALGVALSGTTPNTLTVTLGGQPAAGDSLSVTLRLPDGTTATLQLTADPNASSTSTTSFPIGTTAAQTASNLSGALQRAVANAGQTVLAPASVVQATRTFFGDPLDPSIKDYAGNPSTDGSAPRRIGFDSVTKSPVYIDQLSAADKADPSNIKTTVRWYRGEISNADPRGSVTARTGAISTVEVGARANETEIRQALTSLAAAALAAAGLPAGTTTDTQTARWQAVASRITDLLPEQGAVEAVATSFSLASSALAAAKDSNKATRTALQSAVDRVENVSTEQVAAELLAVQNRLQASYQITATLSKLSLVNYMS